MTITNQMIHQFGDYLRLEEKSPATQEKYLRDVQSFRQYVSGKDMTKEIVIEWKKSLIDKGYAVRSINSMIASINSFLVFLNLTECKVKSIRLQQQIYSTKEKELTKEEYKSPAWLGFFCFL